MTERLQGGEVTEQWQGGETEDRWPEEGGGKEQEESVNDEGESGKTPAESGSGSSDLLAASSSSILFMYLSLYVFGVIPLMRVMDDGQVGELINSFCIPFHSFQHLIPSAPILPPPLPSPPLPAALHLADYFSPFFALEWRATSPSSGGRRVEK